MRAMPDNEPTPEMIEAGGEVIYRLVDWIDDPDALALSVFSAMMAVAPPVLCPSE